MRYRDPVKNAARRLVFEIKAQISPREIAMPTTCLECKGKAVNGGCCAECLTKGLGYIVGTANANQFLDACRQLRSAEDAVMQLAGK